MLRRWRRQFATAASARDAFPGNGTLTSQDEEIRQLRREVAQLRARPDADVFIAERADGSLAGFVEVGTRPYADGCDTSPIGYIEAWYVDPDVRRSGVGRALFAAAEARAHHRGYREMASDTRLDNEISQAAHRRAGYEEVDRVVQFRKNLDAGPAHRDRTA